MRKSAASLDLVQSGHDARMVSEDSAFRRCLTYNRLLEMACPYTFIRTLVVFLSYPLQ